MPACSAWRSASCCAFSLQGQVVLREESSCCCELAHLHAWCARMLGARGGEGKPDAFMSCYLPRFWPEGRVSLWEEKLQLRVPFAGNSATAWGTRQARPAACLTQWRSTCVGTGEAQAEPVGLPSFNNFSR